jgi:hypothetical protein
VDLAQDAAKNYKLPPVQNAEDILDNYSTARILDLSYRIGLLTRGEWRRLQRAYDIRRDLEHEDDEYEATIEDCVYVFGSCIEIVLSRESIALLRVEDVREAVEAPDNVALSQDYLHEYRAAPKPRQTEIYRYLIGVARDGKKPDLTRQNAVELLRALQSLTAEQVKIGLAEEESERLRRHPLDKLHIKIAHAGGYLVYLKQRKLREFFDGYADEFVAVSHDWTSWNEHRPLFEELEDLGGIDHCSDAARRKLVAWMVICYLGEPGGYGHWGRNRPVFYSNTAAPRIERLFEQASAALSEDLEEATKIPRVRAACANIHIGRRLERLRDVVERTNQGL